MDMELVATAAFLGAGVLFAMWRKELSFRISVQDELADSIAEIKRLKQIVVKDGGSVDASHGKTEFQGAVDRANVNTGEGTMNTGD